MSVRGGAGSDLDALREWAELGARNPGCEYMEYRRLTSPTRVLAVLALVDEQRKENERLREGLGKYAKHDALCASVYDYHNDCTCGLDDLRRALAGSPSEKETTDA